jgi:hypothetical protein
MGARKTSQVRFKFDTTIIEWRGPAPFFYAPIPQEHVEELRAVAKAVSYGWGCVPVEATVGGVTFTTSLFPKGRHTCCRSRWRCGARRISRWGMQSR